MTAATAHQLHDPSVDPRAEEALNFPAHLVESMTTDVIVGLLLLRMRALVARGFDPSEALFAAARLEHLQP